MFALMQLRAPVGVAMALVGTAGFGIWIDWPPAFNLIAQSPIRYATDEAMGLVPMFILMGSFAVAGGLGRELFNASNTMIGHRPGGLAVASIWASAGFAAICGSAVASAATMARIALPEMKRLRYDGGFACATIAVGGTLGIMIPPSVVFALRAYDAQPNRGTGTGTQPADRAEACPGSTSTETGFAKYWSIFSPMPMSTAPTGASIR